MVTVIKNLRSDGNGLKGTIENAKHHAEAILPFISSLRHILPTLGFAEWKQGKNVHEFHTTEGVKYTLRAFTNKTKDRGIQYVGIRLALRVSRSCEYRLIDITELDEVAGLVTTMKMLAQPLKGYETGVMTSVG